MSAFFELKLPRTLHSVRQIRSNSGVHQLIAKRASRRLTLQPPKEYSNKPLFGVLRGSEDATTPHPLKPRSPEQKAHALDRGAPAKAQKTTPAGLEPAHPKVTDIKLKFDLRIQVCRVNHSATTPSMM